MSTPYCPSCGKEMRLRTARATQSKFWGCQGFPNCRGTLPYREDVPERKHFEPSEFQKAIFDWIENGTGNAVIDAVAGSGKTTTCVEAAYRIPARQRATSVFLAFNKHIAKELGKKLPVGFQARTLHSYGLAACKRLWPSTSIEEYKTQRVCYMFFDRLLSEIAKRRIHLEDQGVQPDDPRFLELGRLSNMLNEDRTRRDLARAIDSVFSMVKATLTDEKDSEALQELIGQYSLDLMGFENEVFTWLPQIVELSNEQSGAYIDYDDMVYLPVKLGIPVATQRMSMVFVDEAQDLNACQMAFLLDLVTPGVTRIVAVGDPFQSMYGFRGAHTRAIQEMIEKLNATVLPLSVCYRCPTSHLDLAREIVPHIQDAPNAEAGEIGEFTEDELPVICETGDLILCRINAPLVPLAYEFLRKNKKAVVRGRDIGKGLLNLIDRLAPQSMGELKSRLEVYQTQEVAKALDKRMDPQPIQDKCDTLRALMAEYDNVEDLRWAIKSLFSEDTDGVVLSSVHKAKGLEAGNVYILYPDIMPLNNKAVTEDQKQQEWNIKYVALTRAKNLLGLVYRE